MAKKKLTVTVNLTPGSQVTDIVTDDPDLAVRVVYAKDGDAPRTTLVSMTTAEIETAIRKWLECRGSAQPMGSLQLPPSRYSGNRKTAETYAFVTKGK